MKTRLVFSTVLSLLILVTAGCQSVKIVQVNAPAYNCLFSTNCIITVNDTVFNFVTNLPPDTTTASTNASLTGLVQSRTFAGQPGTPEAGLYGYEYRLVLQKLIGDQSVSLSSMTVNFSPYSSFDYNGQTDNQAWVVTSGGVGSVGPTSISANGSAITFGFNPPLTLSSASSEETSSYFFGMISSTPPPTADNDYASFTGSINLTGGGSVPFNWLMLRVRRP
jgi:hypothetical protein